MKIAFLGPKGTFTEEALLATFPVTDDSSFRPVPMSTVYGSVLAVQDEEVNCAFAPIENSLEGSVSDTLDALTFDAPDVSIVREVVHAIRHNLIASRDLALSEIERLISHPHATSQCRRFLHEELGHVEIISANSTAQAVETVASSGEPWAALGTELSASLYDCKIIRADVEDSRDNTTRFVYLARDLNLIPISSNAAWKTSIVCGIGEDRPGALLEILKLFADELINLTKIESRPAKTELGAYLFFIDAEGKSDERPLAKILHELGLQLESLRVLGSYPAAYRT